MTLGRKNLLLLLASLLTLFLLAGSAAANLVVNGGFESGNADFSSGYGYVADPGGMALWNEGYYAIGGNPNDFHSSWTFGPPPHTDQMMMIVNGAPDAGVTVWSQTVSVVPDTTYYFSAWVASIYPNNPAVLNFSINGQAIGGSITPTGTADWQLFHAAWYSGSSGTAALALVNENTIRDGNDFCLDDIQMDTTNPVPLPSALVLVGAALVRLVAHGRRRRL